MTIRLFIFGQGYVAGALAAAVRQAGGQATGTRRTESLPAAHGDLFPFDGSTLGPDAERRLRAATHLLLSIPPGTDGDPALGAVASLADGDLPDLAWAGYLSTTAVYGDTRGGWVDETAPLRPGSARARRRTAAEAAWADWARSIGRAIHIFRLAGIYGPGRNPLEQMRAGTARRLHKPGQVFSRIHVDDIVQVLEASMAAPVAPATAPSASDDGIFNVCDDLPAPSEEVVAHAAALLGLDPPPLVPIEQADMSPMAASFYAECRRVRNRRIKERLGVRLKYPTYREGLAALLRAST